MQPANPHESPDDLSSRLDKGSTSNPIPAERVQFTRYLIALVATAMFLYFGYAFVSGMMARTWWSAVGFAVISLASVPWASTTSRVSDCFAGSLVMALCVGGAALFAIGYFTMFQFDWFEQTFNDKGSGPLGLIMSVALGFAAGGIIGWWCLSCFQLDSMRVARDAFKRHTGK